MTPAERITCAFEGRNADTVPVADFLYHRGLVEHLGGDACGAVGRVLDGAREGVLSGVAGGTETRGGWTLHREAWTEWAEPPAAPGENPPAFLSQWLAAPPDPLRGLDEAVEAMRRESEAVAPAVLWSTLATPELYPGSRHTLGPIGLGAAGLLFGLEQIVYLEFDAPQLLSGFLETWTAMALARLAALPADLPSRVLFAGEDIAHAGGPLYSPDFLAREFFPRLARFVAAAHARGFFGLFHSDGKLDEILPPLVDCGIDGLHPIDVDAGMTVPRLREEYPDLTLAGGIDCNALLARSTPQEIECAVERLVEAGGARYIAGSSAELHEGIPLQNALAMFRALGRV